MSGPFTSRRGDTEPRCSDKKESVGDGSALPADYEYSELDEAKSKLDKNLKELAQSYEALQDVVFDASCTDFSIDLDLNIRSISPSAYRHFDLGKSDLGLPLSSIAQRMGCPDLVKQVRSVFQHSQAIEREIRLEDGRLFHLRITPDKGSKVEAVILRFSLIQSNEEIPRSLVRLVHGLDDAVLLLSADLRVLLANKKFLNGLKLKPEHVLGRHVHAIGEGPWKDPKFQNLLAQVIVESRGQESIELTQHFPDVGDRNLKLNVCRLGEGGRILVTIRDLSPLRLLHAAREREAQLQWEVGVRTRLQEMASDVLQSSCVEEMFNTTLNASIELTGATFSVLQVLEGGELRLVAQRGLSRQKVERFLTKAACRDVASVRAYRQRRRVNVCDILKEDAYEPFQAKAEAIGLRAIQSTPLIGRSGKLMGVLSVIYREPRSFSARDDYVNDLLALEIADLCEWIKTEKRLRQNATRLRAQSEQLLANDRQKNQFLALLGHELRNPLTVMRNSIQTLVSEPSLLAKPRVNEALALLERQSRHMTHLVNDLLDIARINNGKVVLKRERVLLSRCIDEVIGAHRSTLQNRHLQYRILAPQQPIFLDADAARLFQVLDNLITNAIKFTEPGGFIEIDMEVDGEIAIIRITDTGIGISPDAITKLFNPFTQVDNSLACHGLGLGLSLVKSLVNLHGGSIRAHSEGEDQGSQFIIHWPLHAEQDDSETEAAPPRLHLEPTQNRRRILVVDDIADIANSFARLLEVAGHEVFVAYNAQQALKLARNNRPSVAFLDMIMPETDGLELARELRKDFDKDALELVMVSGYGQSEDVERALQAGIDHHLLKPVEVQQVYNLLDKLNGAGDPPQ